MEQKPMLLAEVYARAMSASPNVAAGADGVASAKSFVDAAAQLWPSIATHLRNIAARIKIPLYTHSNPAA
jgi:hypothetical protein